MLKLKDIWILTKQAAISWNEDNATVLAAALAYYTLFSLAPVILITIALAGSLFGEEAVKGQIVDQIQNLVGASSANAVENMIERASNPRTGLLTTIFSIIILLFASTNAFLNLKHSLNLIWSTQSPVKNWVFRIILDRLLSFSLIIFLGFFLILSLIFDAGIVGFRNFLSFFVSNQLLLYLLQLANFIVSLSLTTLMFLLIFKYLPDTKISWKDVWLGSVMCSFLFTLFKLLIAFYLGKSKIGTLFGGASSFIIILIWVYYSAQLLLFGAEFTKNYATSYGSRKKQE